MPKADTFAALVDTATKCFATAAASPPSPASSQSRALSALVIVSSVVKVFDDDDEQRLGRVEVARRLDEVGAVDVGDEAEGQRAVAVVAQRLVGHHRPEVGAADADVDDVPDALAGVALPLAAADAVGEAGHLVEHRVHVGDDVRRRRRRSTASRGARSATCSDGAVLGDVDLLAAEHRVDPLAQPGLVARAATSSASVSSVMRFLE